MYKLLIAEDEALERKALRLILNKYFNNLTILEDAKTGNEAVNLSLKYKPDIILMDIKMPEKDGIEALEDIIEFTPNTKTVVLSAYDNFVYAQKAIKLGVCDYILKPAKPIEIKNSIDKIIKSIGNSPEINSKVSKNSSEDSSLIEKAVNYINDNFTNNINLESVASYVHLNPQYFSRYFKNNMGINFIEYLSRIRIKEGKKLLVSTDKSITNISLIVGYTDASYFTKVFMKHEGVSPHKYRALNRKLNTKFVNKFW